MIQAPPTAQNYARAVVAAARVYGDDPLRALQVTRGRLRRCLAPAALGFERATGTERPAICRVLGVSIKNLDNARRYGGPIFELALNAALGAIVATQEPPPAPPAPSRAPAPKAVQPPSPAQRARLARVPIATRAIEPGKPAYRAPVVGPAAPMAKGKRFTHRGVFSDGARVGTGDLSRTSAPVSKGDRALIEAALASGKMTRMPTACAEGGGVLGLAVPTQPQELTYDRDRKAYVRKAAAS